jgi:polysaccharide biosynthesis/export protein
MGSENHAREQAMMIGSKRLRRRAVLWGLACVVLSTGLWGQAADKDKGSKKQSAAATAETTQHDDSYLIGPEDVLSVNVWKEPDISRTIPVRLDGRISLPLAGEIQAAGRTPHQLEEEITAKLKNYISEPEVAVMVQQIRSKRFNVLGQVVRPGSYLLTNSTTVLDAIAMAGGFRDFAKQKSIYVLRRNADGTEARLPFNYKDVVKGKNMDQNIKLQPRDTVVIP